jgi:hypothetical protein
VTSDDDLPEAYTLVLRLRRDGVDAAGIAEQIGIEPEAVPSLLRLADAKLADPGRDREHRRDLG